LRRRRRCRRVPRAGAAGTRGTTGGPAGETERAAATSGPSSEDGGAPAREDRRWLEQYLGEPFGSFLVEQLAWGAVGFALGLLLGSWTLAVLDAVVFTGSGLLGRVWARRRLARQDREEPARE
jgi:hypothetical protein